MGRRRKREAEGLAVEFEGAEGTRGRGVAGCGCERGEGCVAGGDDDVQLVGCEEEVETVASAGCLEMFACCAEVGAGGAGLEGGHEVGLCWAGWDGVLVVVGSHGWRAYRAGA